MIHVSLPNFQSLLPSILYVAEESCGFLLGTADHSKDSVERFLPAVNRSSNKSICFQINRDDYLKAEEKADRMGLGILGVFHTHINHPALPSSLDQKFAFPDFYYIIISLESSKFTDVRCWKLNERRIFTERIINFTK